MQDHTPFMQRCLRLAEQGLGAVSTNPMVGCVLVHNGTIIGEGYHRKFGESHAEINALGSVKDKELLSESTVYVNLEPCSHFGKTPPCADRLIFEKVKRVVIGMQDPDGKVAGKGIMKLKEAGIEVVTGVMERECRELNRRFIAFHELRRPYIVVKWAQTLDSRIGSGNHEHWKISGPPAQLLSHRWRTEEDAIMVGANTAIFDNPSLSARHWPGRNPIRVLLDSSGRVPANLKIFDNNVKTYVMSRIEEKEQGQTKWINISGEPFIAECIYKLYDLGIQSVIVEGGAQVHQALFDLNLWDEARIFVSGEIKGTGTNCATIPGGIKVHESLVGEDRLIVIRNL